MQDNNPVQYRIPVLYSNPVILYSTEFFFVGRINSSIGPPPPPHPFWYLYRDILIKASLSTDQEGMLLVSTLFFPFLSQTTDLTTPN